MKYINFMTSINQNSNSILIKASVMLKLSQKAKLIFLNFQWCPKTNVLSVGTNSKTKNPNSAQSSSKDQIEITNNFINLRRCQLSK